MALSNRAQGNLEYIIRFQRMLVHMEGHHARGTRKDYWLIAPNFGTNTTYGDTTVQHLIKRGFLETKWIEEMLVAGPTEKALLAYRAMGHKTAEELHQISSAGEDDTLI